MQALGAGGGDLMRTDVLFPPVTAKAGVAWTHELVGFLGPKNYRELEAADAAAGFSLGFTHDRLRLVRRDRAPAAVAPAQVPVARR